MSEPARALVRGLSARFAEATAVHYAHEGPIELAQALTQHAAYVEALGWLGLAVRALPGDDALPDCCFVEDQAVIADDLAVITRSGHPGRRPEAEAVAAALAGSCALWRMEAPACLDGGDVLRLGRTFLVGLGARTNAEGLDALRRAVASRGFTARGVPLPPGVLHLKSACSSPAEGIVLLAEGTVPEGVFEGLARVERLPRHEEYAANSLGRRGRALVSAGYPEARRRLESLGLEVRSLEMSAIRRADGSLTCLSLWF